MHPTTVISLFFLVGISTIIFLLAFLFSNKIKKLIWIISGLILIIGVGFYIIRPFIVENQTEEAVEKLNNYLEEKYPDDTWNVTDTDQHEIQTEVILHVIFNSEQNIVYEYVVNDIAIEQIGMWTITGESVYGRGGSNPLHYEGNGR